MTTNALPVIDGADKAMARRLILLPFKNVIPADERDPGLAGKLEGEAPGILNLLLKGLKQYQERGLANPKDIIEEAAGFIASSDMLAVFLEEQTEAEDDVSVGASELYNCYRAWSGMGGLKSLSSPQFKQEMMKKGFHQLRTKRGFAWRGVRLKPSLY